MKLLLIALVVIMLPEIAAAACRVPPIKTLDNQTVTGYMFTTSGRRCGIKVRNSRGPILSAALVNNAKNGNVVVRGGIIAYTPRAGFVGDDEFTYARRGLNTRNEPIVRTVTVKVNVAAK